MYESLYTSKGLEAVLRRPIGYVVAHRTATVAVTLILSLLMATTTAWSHHRPDHAGGPGGPSECSGPPNQRPDHCFEDESDGDEGDVEETADPELDAQDPDNEPEDADGEPTHEAEHDHDSDDHDQASDEEGGDAGHDGHDDHGTEDGDGDLSDSMAKAVEGHHPGGFTVPSGESWEIVGAVTTDANVVVRGVLKMRAGSSLTFIDIDESAFVLGDVHEPVSQDVGLWVVGQGQLDIRGSEKQAWNRTGSHHTWSADDDYVRAPHGTHESGPQAWALGKGVPCTTYQDEKVCAEIVNLTRDVVIQGTEGGHTHIFIHSSRPQSIKYAAIRHVGIDQGGPSGRYGLHFHHSGDGSRGSIVEGVIIQSSGSHAFVPHASHGITFMDTVALGTTNAAYWWDPDTLETFPQNATDDVTYVRALAMDVQSGYQTNATLHGFYLGQGKGNRAIGSVAIDVASRSDGRQRESSGFYLPRSAGSFPNVWELRDLVSHHNSNGTFTRRNRVRVEPEPGALFDGFTAYQNREWGVYIGPYVDSVAVYEARLFENAKQAVRHRAQSGGKGTLPPYDNTFTGVMDVAGSPNVLYLNSGSTAMSDEVTVVWRDLTLRGWSHSPVLVNLGTARNHDFVEVDADGRDLKPGDFNIMNLDDSSKIRVQRSDGTAFQIDVSGVKKIEPFANG